MPLSHSNRRRIFIVCATVIPLLLAAAASGTYLFGVKHYHWWMARPFLRVRFVRAYLFDPALRRLATALADERADAFVTTWDAGEGVRLSRALFTGVEMNGAPKYMYRPNLRKLMFRTAPDDLAWAVETADTPAVRDALAHVHVELLATASYDALGFRRVDEEVARDCDVRVMFLGDSFTDGMWVNDDETFVNRYGHVARESGRLRVCPVNAGVNGYGAEEEAFVLEHAFEAAGRPRLVVEMYFANDVDADYRALLDGTLADADRKWRESLAHVRRAAAFARAHGSTFIVAAIPAADQWADLPSRARYQDVLERFCGTERIPFVDLLGGLAPLDVRDLYWDWDPHFTPRGHQAVAEVLFRDTESAVRAAVER